MTDPTQPPTTEPRKLDPEATRAAITDAAHVLFVEKGLNGVSMSAIARKARVTKSLIHHHFGTKMELWNEVKMRGLRPYKEWQKETLTSRDADERLLLDSVVGYFRFLQNSPDVVRLLGWMAIDPVEEVERDDTLMKLGVARLAEAQEAGAVRDDVSPECVVLTFLSLCEHYFQFQDVFCHKLGTEKGPAADERFLGTIVKLLERGLRPIDDDGRLVVAIPAVSISESQPE